jgi:hypothetical protein
VFNEALATLYADRYGMEMFCMRIGNVNHAPIDRRRLAVWISGRDMPLHVRRGNAQPARGGTWNAAGGEKTPCSEIEGSLTRRTA